MTLLGCWSLPWEGSLGVFSCTFKGFFNAGTIRIEQKGQSIALYVPGHGLQEVYYASDQWMVSQKMKRLPNNVSTIVRV